MYLLDSSLKKPLHVQLYEQIKSDIVKNYKIDEKLPSIRKIANTYNLSKNTVENAYSQLVIEGFIDSFPKSGYVVVENSLDNFKVCNQEESKPKKAEILYDFYPARLQKNDFPLKTWKRLYSKVVDESLDLGGYSEGQGDFDLRVQISNYLRSSRTVNCSSLNLVISNCFSDALSTIAKILKHTQKTFAMEEPGYYIANEVFESFDYKIEKIDVNEDGIDLEKLEKAKAKIVYVTPSHQYPTGVSIPIKNRLKLLSWAAKNDAYIIEDDYDSELTYNNRPIPSLQGLDKNERVIYIGTFSKSLSASLRVSYMVLPKSIYTLYNNSYESRNPKVCLMTQKTLAKFLEDGYYERHLKKIRTKNKKKQDLLRSLLEKYLKDEYEIVSDGGGLSIAIKPLVKLDLETLEKKALDQKMKIYFAKKSSGGNFQAIRMGFGSFDEELLEKAMKLFSEIWKKSYI